MFEIGRKYRFYPTSHLNGHNGRIYECLFLTETSIFFRSCADNGTLISEFAEVLSSANSAKYKLYVEPRKGTCWLNVYQSGTKPDHFMYSPFTERINADKSSHNRIACIEVPWTEGEGL